MEGKSADGLPVYEWLKQELDRRKANLERNRELSKQELREALKREAIANAARDIQVTADWNF
jgi:hypothetical protein